MDPYESIPHRRGSAGDRREMHGGEIDCSVHGSGKLTPLCHDINAQQTGSIVDNGSSPD